MHWIKSENCDIVVDKWKSQFSKFKVCAHYPKVEIFVEMFRTKLQRFVWSRHVGGLL